MARAKTLTGRPVDCPRTYGGHIWIEGATPHPVLLPMGEGTPERAMRLQQRPLSQRERDRVRGGTPSHYPPPAAGCWTPVFSRTRRRDDEAGRRLGSQEQSLVTRAGVADAISLSQPSEEAWIEVIQKMDAVYAELVENQVELESKNAALEEAQTLISSVFSSMTDVLAVCGRTGASSASTRRSNASRAAARRS